MARPTSNSNSSNRSNDNNNSSSSNDLSPRPVQVQMTAPSERLLDILETPPWPWTTETAPVCLRRP